MLFFSEIRRYRRDVSKLVRGLVAIMALGEQTKRRKSSISTNVGFSGIEVDRNKYLQSSLSW